MFKVNFKRVINFSFLATIVLLLMSFLIFQQTANADAYIKIEVNHIDLYNGQLQIQTTISNLGDRNATVTGVYFDKINITNSNGSVLWDGWANFNNMSVYVSAGGYVNHTFNVNNNSVHYYSGYIRWNYHYTAYWNRH